jgi:hypothetical protein
MVAGDRGGDVSPAWARRGGWSLHFYFSEPHQVPHVAVRSGSSRASIRISDGEVLAEDLPPRVLREVRALLASHRDLAAEAFATTVAFEFPGTLEEMLERAQSDPGAEEVDDER